MAEWDVAGQGLLDEGMAAWQAGRRAEAEALYRQVVERFPLRPEGYNKLGTVYANARELDEAEQYFRQALSRDARHVPALTNLGNIYLERGDVDEAIRLYLLALNADSEYAPAHRNLAIAYRRQGRISLFVSHWKRSQRLTVKGWRNDAKVPLAGGLRLGEPLRAGRLWWWIAIGVLVVVLFHRVRV